MKVLFLINSLGGGGAERVLVNLVNHMDHNKYDITVETLFGGGVNRDLLDESIHYIEHRMIDFKGVSHLFKIIPSSLLARLFINRNVSYDLCVAFIQGPATKVIAGVYNSKKIAWLHCTTIPKYIGKCWINKNMTIHAYKRFDMVCGVSRDVIKEFSDYANIKIPQVVAYNTNDTKMIRQKCEEPYEFKDHIGRLRICSVGRLALQKGFDRLINAAVRLHKEGSEFDIYILGEGSKRIELETMIIRENASEYIHLMGFCDNPYSIMAKCDMFICSSRYEGLSTALTEALIIGLPIVSTDVSGAKEVLGDNNEYGLVVDNNEDGIYYGLKTLITDPILREKYRKKAIERSIIYETNTTVKYVEDLLDKVVNNSISN